MTPLRFPSKRFQCLSVKENKQILVVVTPPSIWILEKEITYAYMSKEEREVFDELFLWKVVIGDEVHWMSKEALKPLLEADI